MSLTSKPSRQLPDSCLTVNYQYIKALHQKTRQSDSFDDFFGDIAIVLSKSLISVSSSGTVVNTDEIGIFCSFSPCCATKTKHKAENCQESGTQKKRKRDTPQNPNGKVSYPNGTRLRHKK